MVKMFIAILVLGVMLILVVGASLELLEPMPTGDTELARYVDDISLDKAILEGRVLSLPFLKELRGVMRLAALFAIVVAVTGLIAWLSSSFGGPNLMVILRWRREDEAVYHHSAYKAPDRKEGSVPVYRIRDDD